MKMTAKLLFYTLLIGLGLGIGIDTLVRQPTIGLNMVVIVWGWVAVCLIIAQRHSCISHRSGIYALLATVSSGLMFFRSAPVVQFWLFCIAGVSLGLLAAQVGLLNYSELALRQRLAAYLGHVFGSAKRSFLGSIRLLSRGKMGNKTIPDGVFIAAALAVIFLLLFAAADQVIAGWFSGLGHTLARLSDLLNTSVGTRVLGSAFWTVASLTVIVGLLDRSTALLRPVSETKQRLTLTDIRIILWTLAGIFAVFVVVQCRYLFGGVALPDHLTYAAYAHQGYGQLLFATLLAAAAVKYTLTATSHQPKRLDKMLAVALLVLNAVVALAAWKRLSLYEATYGWTMLRFIARLGLICIGIGTASMVAWVMGKLTSKQLYATGWYIVAGVLLLAAIFNPEGIITRQNIVERPSRSVVLDVGYLQSLSPDSWPTLCRYAATLQQNYPDEYQALKENHKDQTVLPNHGLSRHYTGTAHFKSTYASCLR